MNHEICLRRSRQPGTMLLMQLVSQRRLKGKLPTIYVWHTPTANGPGGIFNKLFGLVLGNHAPVVPCNHRDLQKWFLTSL